MAKLVYTDQSGREMTVPLGPDSPVVSVGRATDCTIRSNRKSVSRRHAEFHFNNGRYEVVDLNSSNGTYLIVDDRRQPVHDPQPLNHYDEVWCGDFILRFLEEESDFATSGGDDFGVQAGAGFGQEASLGNEVSAGVSGNFGQQPASGRHAPPADQGREQSRNFDSPSGGQQNNQSQPPVHHGQGTPAPQGNAPSQDMGDTPPPVSGNMSRGAGQNTGGYQEVAPGHGNSGPAAPNQRSPSQAPPSQPATPPGSGPTNGQPADHGADPAELQRLRDEKQSIQELCDRQAQDLDALRERYEETLQELEQAQNQAVDPGELERVQSELADAQQKAQQLEQDLALARQDSLDLDDAQQRAEEAEQRLGEASEKIDDLRQQLDISQQDYQAQIADLEQTLTTTEAALTKAQQEASSDDVKSLQEEVARLERLLGEFEKRNRDLQLDLDEHRSTNSDLTTRLESAETDLAATTERAETLETQLKSLQAERDTLAGERDELLTAQEQLQAQSEEYRSEVEGLKQRLRLEKERAKANSSHEEVEAMQAQIEALNEQLQEAQTAGDASPSEVPLGDLANHARTLDRIVDAIERTDLSALSTVDRVRLQSAIRETKPRQTLSAMLELVDQD